MGFSNNEQLRELFLCGGVGFLLGAYYDVFRVWRLWFSSRAVSVFLQDVFFCVTGATALFLLLLAITDGRGRFYVFVGIVVGFLAYRYTWGACCLRAAAAVKGILSRQREKLRKKRLKKSKKAKKGLESNGQSVV